MVSNTSLKFLQNNAHRSETASVILNTKIIADEIDVLFIQEPQTNENDEIIGLPEGNLFYQNKDERPRSGIWLSDKIVSCVKLDQFFSRDVVPVKITVWIGNIKKQIVVCSAYFDSNVKEIPSELVQLAEYCAKKKLDLLIGCDANAHNTIWGSDSNNVRGDMVLDFILSHKLDILNKGNKPTFYRTGVRTIVDLTLATANLQRKITNWRVNEEASGSDHVQIEFEWRGVTVKRIEYRIPQNTDWDKYRKLVEIGLNDMQNQQIRSRSELDNFTENITEIIKGSYHAACPLLVKESNTNKKWFNRRIKKLKKELNRRWNNAKKPRYKFLNRHNCQAWNDYYSLLTKYNNEIKKAKEKSFDRTCKKIDDLAAGSRLYKLMSKTHINEIGTFKKADNEFTESDLESLKLLAETHFPESVLVDDINIQDEINRHVEVNIEADEFNDISTNIFTNERLKWAIKSFKPFKSAGMDGIFPALFQKAINLLIPSLKKIFINSHKFGYIPKIWRNVQVKFIPKGNKTQAYDAKSVRPISLTSFMMKIMEKILDRWIRENMEDRFSLNDQQFAYQEGKSTLTALRSLTSRIEKVIMAKQFSINAFIDIEGAFNNLDFNAIKSQLETRRIDNMTITWIMEMLQSRLVHMTLGEETIIIKATRGCPQGGVSSPLLWCLVADTLIKNLQNGGFSVEGFADDIVFGISGICARTVSSRIDDGLKIVENWCRDIGLTVNPAKTVLVPFTNWMDKSFVEKLIKPEFFGKKLDYEGKVKYLGMILDTRMTFGEHRKFITDKAKKVLYTCKTLVGKNWGLKPKMIKWMYESIVIPTLTYGAIIWQDKMKIGDFQKAFDSVQRIACSMITSCLKSTPLASLEVLLGLPPIHLRILAEARITNYRFSVSSFANIRALKVGTLTMCTGSMRNRTAAELQHIRNIFKRSNTDYMTPRYIFEHNFEVDFPSRDEWIADEVLPRISDMTFFTDGSKTDTGTGFGFYRLEDGFTYYESLEPTATICQAEIQGILTCAQHILSNEVVGNREIIIASDSKAALQALQGYRMTSVLTFYCIEKLNEIGRNNSLKLVWVPGHSGIEGNEEADALARDGSDLDHPENLFTCGVSLSIIKSHFKCQLMSESEEHFQNTEGLRQSKKFIKRWDCKRICELLSMTKEQIRWTVGLFTGHGKFRYHLKKMKLIDDASCRFCGIDEETAEHLICDCENEEIMEKRMNILRSEHLNPVDLEGYRLTRIYNFLEDIGITEQLQG